jgi:hypothetical protein
MINAVNAKTEFAETGGRKIAYRSIGRDFLFYRKFE